MLAAGRQRCAEGAYSEGSLCREDRKRTERQVTEEKDVFYGYGCQRNIAIVCQLVPGPRSVALSRHKVTRHKVAWHKVLAQGCWHKVWCAATNRLHGFDGSAFPRPLRILIKNTENIWVLMFLGVREAPAPPTRFKIINSSVSNEFNYGRSPRLLIPYQKLSKSMS